MSQRALISVVILFCLKISALYAQVPTLDPEQTVNPANGRMEFSLPLGTVKGVNGYDFPIMLNYQSGIRFNQEASDVGLGFSCMAGSITRRVVNVPDNNNGPYTFEKARFTECGMESWDKALFSFFITVAEYFASIFCPPIGSAISFAHNMASLSGLEPSSSDYLPNGIESYDYAHNSGVGFFKGGNATDLPDNYFVSTPYISGQLAWVGDPASGHFVLKHALGSTVNDFETIKVAYHYNEGFQKEYWTIKLPDGRKLVFNAKDNYGNLMNVRAEGNILNDERNCHALFSALSLKEPSPSTWYLTAVLGSDYVDGDNDPEPEDPADGAQNKGSWIAFQYNPITIYPGWHKTSVDLQACLYGSYYTNDYGGYTNGSVNKIYNQLSKIITPNESAEFNYTETRLDNLWIGSNDYFKGIKRLNSLSIKTKNNVVRQSVVFNADYTLRPGSHHSYLKPDGCSNGYINPPPGNTHGACLTLNSIVVQAYDGGVIAKQYPVFFIYDPLKNPDITLRGGWTAPHCSPKPVPTPVLVEHKDLWGYYSRNTTGTPNTPDYHNDFNPQGLLSKEQETDSWSLKSITFPFGMTIEWSYEPNRYDRLNGNSVTSDQGAPRYGGGIRVSKMTVNNGSGNSAETWNYFYTSTNGNFVEVNNNSSGYATIEPFDYTLKEKNDGLSGGHYTSDMVGYEKVQVVKNYNALSTPHAPNGYTVYDFTHAGDPAINGYHPNGGYDGKIDSSWTRGLLLAKSIYNSTNKLVSKVENNYEFVPLITVRNPVSNDVLDPLFREMQANTVGWARIQRVETTVNGVKQTKTFKYANNVSIR